jgi:hypothetical protein
LNSLNLNILNRATLSKKSRDAVRLTEAVVVVCPNPRCGREFEEPILLTILSVTPPKQYEACPYCFAKLEQEVPIEQNEVPEPTIKQKIVPEPTVEQKETIIVDEEEETAVNQSVNTVLEKVKDSAPSFFKKFKSLIPSNNGLKKEKKEKTKEPQAEPAVKKEKAPKEKPKTEPNLKKEEQKPEPSANKEDGSSGCPETFGYLANRPKNVPIPQGCLICPKMVDCVLSPREY